MLVKSLFMIPALRASFLKHWTATTVCAKTAKLDFFITGSIGTIMAYGQTGAGKTFTMTGTTENFKHRGIIPRAISNIFREIDERPEQSVSVRCVHLSV